MDTYDLEQVNNIFRKLSLERYSTDTHALKLAVISAREAYLQTPSTVRHVCVNLCMRVCVQAVPSVSVLLLKDQLLPEAGAGAVVAG